MWRLTAFFALTFTFSGHAAGIEFDPDSCKVKDPEGMTYIALGETVLRLPISRLSITRGPDPRAVVHPAPDPDEPVGCRNNPFVQGSLMFFYGLDAWLKDRRRASGALLESIRLIDSPADYWGRRYSEYHEPLCKKYIRHIELNNGMRGCLLPINPERPDRDEVGTYAVDKKIYSAPFDEVFNVRCSPGLPDGVKCIVSYKVLPKVNLVYEFLTSKIALEDVIEFDRLVRAQIYRAVDKEYKWN